jgi:hypothetical protein
VRGAPAGGVPRKWRRSRSRRDVEAEHHPALVLLGDMAMRHPDPRATRASTAAEAGAQSKCRLADRRRSRRRRVGRNRCADVVSATLALRAKGFRRRPPLAATSRAVGALIDRIVSTGWISASRQRSWSNPTAALMSPQPSACDRWRPQPTGPRARADHALVSRGISHATRELELPPALDDVVHDERDDDEDDRERKKPGPPAVSCDEHIDLRSCGSARHGAASCFQYLPRAQKREALLCLSRDGVSD